MQTIEKLAENFINGNLSDAKRAAKRHTEFRISMYFRQVLCWSFEKSVLTARYLKTGEGWQAACDAK
tara:strand:+ start:53 stop:253 length:201 start_codon:yes stop_codon:yes gene_type:complete